jgi:hypothetical protein
MHQVLSCLEKKEEPISKNLTQRQISLINLGKILYLRQNESISKYVKRSLDSGATKNDVLKVMAFILGDGLLLDVIINLIKELNYEENIRQNPISIIDDCRE